MGIRGVKRALVMAGMLSGGTLFLGAQALAAKVYRLQGVVTRLSSEALTVEDSRSMDELEFSRGDVGLRLPKDLKVGDRVNLWYTMDAQKLHLVRNPGAPEPQAGESGEGAEPKLQPQKDDRIFFNADSGSDAVPTGKPAVGARREKNAS